MENKKQDAMIDKFAHAVDSMSEELLEDNMGYILFGYERLEKGMQENTFLAKGSMQNMADCLYSAMKSNEGLAYMITAAANAYGQMRMAALQEAQKETKKPKVVS